MLPGRTLGGYFCEGSEAGNEGAIDLLVAAWLRKNHVTKSQPQWARVLVSLLADTTGRRLRLGA